MAATMGLGVIPWSPLAGGVLTGRFDREGLLAVEYTVEPPHRGAYRFGPVDLRCWRPGGWLVRQVRILAGVGPTEVELSAHPVRPGERAQCLVRQAGPRPAWRGCSSNHR